MSLLSLWRNSWLSLTGALVMTITLVIISFFFTLNLTVSRTAKALEDKINIVVYFKDEASDDQVMQVKQLLESRPDVQNVAYVSKDEAKKRFDEINHLNEELSTVFTDGENPLPRSLEIKPTQATATETIFNYLKDPSYTPLIRKISYEENKAVIDRLIRLTSFFTKTGIVMSIIFMIISVLIIYNTIKLAIFSRKAEISIMRLVGATDVFVKFPFIVEGMLYGIVATIIGSLIMYFGFMLITPAINNYLSGIDVGLAGFLGSHFVQIVFLQLGVGLVLGAGCSWFATKRYVN